MVVIRMISSSITRINSMHGLVDGLNILDRKSYPTGLPGKHLR